MSIKILDYLLVELDKQLKEKLESCASYIVDDENSLLTLVDLKEIIIKVKERLIKEEKELEKLDSLYNDCGNELGIR